MALPRAGVQLVAEGAAQYFGDMEKGGAATKKFGEDAQEGAHHLNAFEQIATGALRKVGEMAINFGLQAGQAIIGAFTSSIDVAAKFESTMSGVKALLQPTGEEFKALSDKALQLGKDTSFSAQQAGEAIAALGANGLTATQILDGAADATVALAAATGTNLTNAATIATDTMADFGISATDVSKAINGIAGVTVASKFGIDDYRLALAQAGGVAGSVGVSFDDFNTSITATSSLFASGSDSGTSFKTFLTELIPKSTDAGDAMKKLGLITADGKNQFFDATGKMKSMAEISGMLGKALNGLSDEQRNMALKTIFGTDAMRTAVGLAKVGKEGFEALAAQIAKVDAGAQAKIRMDNFSGALEATKGSVETLQIVVGSKLLPVLTQLLLKGVTPIINGLTEFAQHMDDAGGPVQTLATFLKANLEPALITLTIAAMAYAVTTVPALIAANTAAIASFVADAVAVATATASFALFAVPIYLVIKALTDFNTQLNDATANLLSGKKFWIDSADALDRYEQASEATRAGSGLLADQIGVTRDLIASETKSLGERMVEGKISEAQYQAELAVIKNQATALGVMTNQLNSNLTAQLKATAGTITATGANENLGESFAALPEKVELTEKELDKLAKEFEKIMKAGASALDALTSTHVDFISKFEEAQTAHEDKILNLMKDHNAAKTKDAAAAVDAKIAKENEGYLASAQAQALAYAQQAAAQKQALGEQLLAYTENQRQMGNITDEKAAEITAITVKHFGIMKDNSVLMFGQMAQAVDKFAQDGKASASSLITKFDSLQSEADDTKAKFQALEKKYTAEIIANWDPAKQSIQDVQRALEEIPRRVNTEITVTTHKKTVEEGGTVSGGESAYSGKAIGGDVKAGTPYIVGEKRPELFVPKTDGVIVPTLAEGSRYSPPAIGTNGYMGNTNNTFDRSQSTTFQIINPAPAQVDSVAAMVRLQQMLSYN